MTDRSTTPSLIEEEEATDAGAQGLAAADLAGQVMRLLEQALAVRLECDERGASGGLLRKFLFQNPGRHGDLDEV